jgi:chromosome segregation ATPase
LLRGQSASGEIAALNGMIGTVSERLELAREQLDFAQSQLRSARAALDDQEREITALRQERSFEPAKAERLAESNTKLRGELNSVGKYTSALNEVPSPKLVRALSKVSATKDSG